jgi:tubulin--tyrosine ligase
MLSTFPYVAGKAYLIKEVTKGSYFYPREDGQGDISAVSRPLKDDELVREALVSLVGHLISLFRLNGYLWMGYGSWPTPSSCHLMIQQTPATCVNVALHNLFSGQIDLVVCSPCHARSPLNSPVSFRVQTLGVILPVCSYSHG